MSKGNILLSIRPQYAKKILQGYKCVELRRVCPKYIQKDSLVFMYVSSPVQAVKGAFRVDCVIRKPLDELWDIVKDQAGISRQDFDLYYTGISHGSGICFTEVWKFANPIKLQELKKQVSGFCPPQGFRYVTENELISTQISHFVKKTKPIIQKVSLCTRS